MDEQMQIYITVDEFIEIGNRLIADGEELEPLEVNVFVFWALRFCSLFLLEVHHS